MMVTPTAVPSSPKTVVIPIFLPMTPLGMAAPALPPASLRPPRPCAGGWGTARSRGVARRRWTPGGVGLPSTSPHTAQFVRAPGHFPSKTSSARSQTPGASECPPGRQPGNRFSLLRGGAKRTGFPTGGRMPAGTPGAQGSVGTERSVWQSGWADGEAGFCPRRAKPQAAAFGDAEAGFGFRGVGMAAAAVAGLVLGGEETLPAGPRKRSSRRRNLAVALLSAIGAASAGAAFGGVGSPNPRDDEARVAGAAYTAAAAVQAAQRSEERAVAAERALSEVKARLEALRATGAIDELEQVQAAETLGLDRIIKSESILPKARRPVLAAVIGESRRNGLDPMLVAAIIKVESRFDPFAVSHVGALGLMQLMPPTAQELASAKLNKRHLFDPVLNIELGTAYVAQLLRRFDGDLNKALIAYNAGPSVARSVKKGSRAYRRLDAYPQAVIAAYRDLTQGRQAEAVPLAQR